MTVNKTVLAQAGRRITDLRSRLALRYPFFGKLILRLKVRFGEVGTACTDMDSITFDLSFMQKLSDAQLEFVMFHEVMHCVFKHCVRGHGKLPLIYNIACDIVVNSFILDILGLSEFIVDGEEVMHLAPDDTEGREYTAEQVYDMLIRGCDLQKLEELYGKGSFDDHSGWGEINAQNSSAHWDKYVRDAAEKTGEGGWGNLPVGLRRRLEQVSHRSKTNWRQLLQDYIRVDRFDYDFTVPDRRFQDGFILPSFCESDEGDTVTGLWLFVDASGSVSEKELAVLMGEIRSAYDQVENISGKISFFDAEVSKPLDFDSCEELEQIEPVGGGGTDFRPIFRYIGEQEESERPELILIFTDGWAPFPDEKEAMDIPVIWLILDSDRTPPWGHVVYVDPDS